MLEWAGDREVCATDAAAFLGVTASTGFQLLRAMCDEGYFDEIRRGVHVYFKATGKKITGDELEEHAPRWAPCLLAQVWR